MFHKTLSEIHNHIWANEGLSSQQAFEEIIKILFVKIFDEENSLEFFFITKDELRRALTTGRSGTFERRMSDHFKHTTQNFRSVFDSSEKIKLRVSTQAYVVNKLQNIYLRGRAGEVKGDIFQKFVETKQRSERGQFFTPPYVVDLCVKLLDPKPNDTVMDPACGSGGFLGNTINYMASKENSLDRPAYINKNIVGVEINPSITRIAKMGVILLGGSGESIINADALSKEFTKIVKPVDIIFANPPFGTAGKVENKKILQGYDLSRVHKKLGKQWAKTLFFQNGQSPEILFIERIIKLLKIGGRAAIVLPSRVFENPSIGYVREYIRKNASILGIISLPDDTFVPYGTSVRTSVLFIQKAKEEDRRVFMSKFKSKTHKVLADYREFGRTHRVLSPQSYVINLSEMEDRLDYEFNHPKYKALDAVLKEKETIPLGEVLTIRKENNNLDPKAKVKYVEVSDVNWAYNEIISCQNIRVKDLPRRAVYSVRKGDILIATVGNFIGTDKHAMALVDEAYDGAICSNAFRVLGGSLIDKYYLLYFLKSDIFLKQVRQFRTGTLIPTICEEDLRKLLIVIPKHSEVVRISKAMAKSFELRKQSWTSLKKQGL